MEKAFSASSHNNREPILAVLRERLTVPANFSGSLRLLEVGSGTGQHAVFFGAELPHVHWQCSELANNLSDMAPWLSEAGLANVAAPIALDVRAAPWAVGEYDAIYTANTLHIMDWSAVEATFAGVAQALTADGQFLSYGPFRYGGSHTSEGNARFDAQLRGRGAGSGIRDLDDLLVLAAATGLRLAEDVAMPVNNRILVWRRSET